MGALFDKSPLAELDYLFDWAPLSNGSGSSDWLAPGELIAQYTVTADPGINLDQSYLVDGNTAVQVWLSGGTAGEIYNVHCDIQTNADPPRVDRRTMYIRCLRK